MLTYKCTRPDGTDFLTGKINYAEALSKGIAIEHETEPANGRVCGVGLHVSLTAKQTIQFANRTMRPWRWFEGEVNTENIVEQDKDKLRVSKFKPIKEIYLEDIFGKDFAKRIEQVKTEIDTWKDIPWFKPKQNLKNEHVIDLAQQFIHALQPYTTTILLKNVKIVNNVAAAYDTVAAAYNTVAANAVAVAANANVDAAVDADAYAYAVADAVDAVTVAANAYAVAANANAADAADDAATAATTAAVAAGFNWYWLQWCVSPYYMLRRHAYCQIAGMKEVSPFAILVKLYRLGCMPIGYINNELVIYIPKLIV